jgi:hypothetical protein
MTPLLATNPQPCCCCHPAGGSWITSFSPILINDVSDTIRIFAARGGLPNNAISMVNLAMCAPGATMSYVGGRLVCSALATSGPVVPPSGNWYTECSPMGFNNSILSAYCSLTYGNGTARMSRLNTTLCSSSNGQIKAAFGQLLCDSTAPFLPGGDWLKVCSPLTFRRGGLLKASCGAPNGALSIIDYRLCAVNATLSLVGYRLICSAPAVGLPGEAFAAGGV